MSDEQLDSDVWAEFAITPEVSSPLEGTTQGDDDWSEFSLETTENVPQQTGDLAMAAQQFSAGTAEGAGGLAGMLKGGALGLKAPVPHPFARGGFAILGGLTGLFGGTAVVDEALDYFGVDDPEDLPEDQRPLAYGVRSLGGAAPFLVAPYAAAARNVQLVDQGVGKLVNQIIRTAKESPKAFGALETSSALTAATAAGVAEELAPGETGTRVTSEILGGVFAPGNLVAKAYRSSAKTVRNMISKMSPAARETQAAKQIQEVLEITGEDPSMLVEMLKMDNVLDANGKPVVEGLTAAQRTGSEALSALQNALMDASPDYRAIVSKKETDALDAMRGITAQLTKTGDPEALQVAAQMKSQYIRSLLQSTLDSHTQQAVQDARKISKDSPEAIAEISTSARDALDTTVKQVRTAESKLWEAVPKDIDANLTNLESTFANLKQNLLPELQGKQIPNTVEQFLARKSKEAKGDSGVIIVPDFIKGRQPEALKATTGELKQLRSEMLDMARQATNAGEFNQARIYSDLANSVLDDIDQAFLGLDSEAYNSARTFSREMNEVFTRSFVGKATGEGKYGDRIAPEMLLRKAMASGKEAGDLQFRQLQNATQFLDNRAMGNEVTQEAAALMLDAQDRFTRTMFSNAIDPATGLVNTKRLSTMMRDNEALLKRFPEIEKQLLKAFESEQGRKSVENFVKGKIRHIEQIKMFEQISGKDPITMATRALAAPNVEKEIGKMITATKGGNVIKGLDSEEALRGVSASVLTAALRNATDSTGTINLNKFKALVADAPVQGGKSPLDILKAKGAVDVEHYNSMQKVFDMLEKLQKSSKPGHAVELDKDASSVALEFLSRVAGTSVAGKAGAKSIQAHQASANLAQHITKKLTSAKMDEIFIRALNDKEFMITLLQKVDTAKKAEIQARQVNAWLYQATTDLIEDDGDEQ